MRTYNESTKSKKTVASMIEKKGDDKDNKKNGKFKIFTKFKIKKVLYTIYNVSIIVI